MMKRLFKLFKPRDDQHTNSVIHTEHEVSQYDVSKNARKVIEKLKSGGYVAYLVGGGVRDLLLGEQPKDFDIATSATPEQVKSLFSNSRIIGKRFRIVHVRYGRDIIEVTTFRGRPKKASNSRDHSQSDNGMLLRDNVYGDIESDAIRRDFTITALYYSPEDNTILDYTGGLTDLEKRQLRIIGNASERYREDPVRMLRAARFAAKLGFAITPESENPIFEHAGHLIDIPPARLFEEVLKLFCSGYATAVLSKLRELDLFRYLFPGTHACIEPSLGERDDTDRTACEFYDKLISAMVINTDKRLRRNKRVTPAFIYAAMLWPPLDVKIKALMSEQSLNHHDALQHAAQGVISEQLSYTSIPKRFLIPMREIWSLQHRLQRRDGRKAFLLMEHPRFRAAYDFLLLREEAGEDLQGLGLWWTRFQDADNDERADMVKTLAPKKRPRARRRRGGSKTKTNKPNERHD